MPTTVDRFFAVVQICQNVSTMQNNMRANVQFIRDAFNGIPPGTALFGNLPAAQRAMRDLGNAFQQRLTLNQAIMTAFPAQLSAGAIALGIVPADVISIQALLVTWAGNLQTALLATSSDLDTQVTNLRAAVPAAMLPF